MGESRASKESRVESRPPGRGARIGRSALVANAKFEALIFLLLLVTFAAIEWEDRILLRTTHITPATLGAYTTLAQTDSVIGGRSTITPGAKPLAWSCDLKPGFDYPYCGYELLFDGQRAAKGIDLSNLHSIAFTIRYTGPAKTLRFHLKNFDARYSTPGVGKSGKFNKVEFPAESGKVQTVDFNLSDFSVADWWLRDSAVPPKLSHPQFDNIVSLDFQTGTIPALGTHRFEVREITLRKAALTSAQWYLMLLGIWVVLIGAFLVYRIRNLKHELVKRQALQDLTLRQAEQAEEAARLDHLTQVYNRRGVAERFEKLPLTGAVALILIDIDRFKMLNDRHGHARGDEVLAAIAALIRRNVRQGDTVARWGGEEFLILCPGLSEADALFIADKIRRRIEHARFADCGKVTASFGVHTAASTEADLTELVASADLALYAAKRQGRNRVLAYRDEMADAA
ncbi:MAG: GGDEF domain-containing protein [Pseudomonadota bacterium]